MKNKMFIFCLFVMIFMLVPVHGYVSTGDQDISVSITQVKAGVPYMIKSEGSVLAPGTPVTAVVHVKNNRALASSSKLEVGIYPEALVNQWFGGGILASLSGSGISGTPNCVVGEDNVDTVLVSLNGLEEKDVILNAKTQFQTLTAKTPYNILAVSFDTCYNDAPAPAHDTGLHDADRWVFFMNPYVGAEPSCSDHMWNQDETDIDCGGVCQPCNEGYLCDVNTDCATGFCTSGRCVFGTSPSGSDSGSGGGLFSSFVVPLWVWLATLGAFLYGVFIKGSVKVGLMSAVFVFILFMAYVLFF